MAITLDGTLGITSPAETVQGALTTTGNTILGDASTDTLNVGNGGLVKDASGNVGIGTATPSTWGKFAVVGASSGGQVVAAIANTSGTANTQAVLSFDTTNNGFNVRDSQIRATNNGSNLTTLEFYTSNSATPAERMRIDSSGNVGIGTSSLSGKFNVQQDQAAYSYFDYTNATNGGGVVFRQIVRNLANTGTTSVDLAKLINSGFVINNNDTGAANYTGFGVGASERMRIDSSGNLLVGTTSLFTANTKLTVKSTAGTAPAADFYSASSGDVGQQMVTIGKYDNNTTTSQVFQRFAINNGANASGQINANGANAAAFGSWSDSRLKENIVDLPPQLDNIMALRPVEYDYIESEGGGHQIGFVAQEVQTIYPDLVGERADGMFTLTDLNKNDARLIKAIQEQQALIIQLQADVATLKALSA